MKSIIIKISTLFLVLVTLTGCGFSALSTRQSNPIVQDYLGWGFKPDIGTMAMDASRRLMIIRTENGNPEQDGIWQTGEFCSEPPPDAMVNTASQIYEAIAAKIKATDPSAGGTNIEGSGQNQFMQQIASSMSPLLRRSQGLQWSRDNLSFACNARLNRTITKKEYLDLVKDIIKQSQSIISAEIEHLPQLNWNISGSPSSAPTLLVPPTQTAP